jgi:hypothetical protein
LEFFANLLLVSNLSHQPGNDYESWPDSKENKKGNYQKGGGEFGKRADISPFANRF